MDEDLKQHLSQMEGRLEAKAEMRQDRIASGFERRMGEMEARLDLRLDARLDAAFTRFSQHILHEVGLRFNEVDIKLASIDERLKVQAGLIQAGAKAMARFSAFAESSEARWVDLAVRLAAVEERLRRLDAAA